MQNKINSYNLWICSNYVWGFRIKTTAYWKLYKNEITLEIKTMIKFVKTVCYVYLDNLLVLKETKINKTIW